MRAWEEVEENRPKAQARVQVRRELTMVLVLVQAWLRVVRLRPLEQGWSPV